MCVQVREILNSAAKPPAIQFGIVPLNSTGSPLLIFLSNTSTTPVHATSTTTTGTNSGNFALRYSHKCRARTALSTWKDAVLQLTGRKRIAGGEGICPCGIQFLPGKAHSATQSKVMQQPENDF